MSRIALFRSRQIWMPTIFGLFFLLFIGLVISLLVVRNIYPFLAQNEPVGASILVVEGWLAPKELDQAILTFKEGNYENLLTTGGPIIGWPEFYLQSTYAKRAANYLALHGVPRNKIIIVEAPASAQDRTFLSAVALRNSEQSLGIKFDSIDIFSSGAHSRRSRLLFQMAFGQKVRIGVLAARPDEFNPDTWWRSSSGVQSLVFQSIALLWVKCCFWPGSPGSQQELWDAP